MTRPRKLTSASRASAVSDDPRAECYDAIIRAAKEGLARYYQEYPHMIGDDRSKEAIAWSTRGIERLLRILDGYEITKREGGR